MFHLNLITWTKLLIHGTKTFVFCQNWFTMIKIRGERIFSFVETFLLKKKIYFKIICQIINWLLTIDKLLLSLLIKLDRARILIPRWSFFLGGGVPYGIGKGQTKHDIWAFIFPFWLKRNKSFVLLGLRFKSCLPLAWAWTY